MATEERVTNLVGWIFQIFSHSEDSAVTGNEVKMVLDWLGLDLQPLSIKGNERFNEPKLVDFLKPKYEGAKALAIPSELPKKRFVQYVSEAYGKGQLPIDNYNLNMLKIFMEGSFDQIDLNKDSGLSFDEVYKFLSALDTEQKLREVFNQLDSDGDGNITKNDLVAINILYRTYDK